MAVGGALNLRLEAEWHGASGMGQRGIKNSEGGMRKSEKGAFAV